MINFIQQQGLIKYDESIVLMRDAYNRILMDKNLHGEIIMFECYPIYTSGSSSKSSELLSQKFDIIQTERGGAYTYHGPGQLVVYPILDLNALKMNVKEYVSFLENWIVSILNVFYIESFADEKNRGVWCRANDDQLAKIASIGIKITKDKITQYGFSINISPNLDHFDGIVSCGIVGVKQTSMEILLRKTPSFYDVSQVCQEQFNLCIA